MPKFIFMLPYGGIGGPGSASLTASLLYISAALHTATLIMDLKAIVQRLDLIAKIYAIG
jgi:hypothetical protein